MHLFNTEQNQRESRFVEHPLARGPRLLFLVYCIHLFVPAFLLIDILYAAERGLGGPADLAIGLASGLWLLVALFVIYRSRNRARFLHKVRGPLLSVYALCFAFGMVELALQVIGGGPRPTLWTPNMHYVSQTDTSILPGVSQVAHFRVNELGLRGPSLPRRDGIYRIIAVGGSTTLCTLLDDLTAWPQQLMDEMNARQSSVPVWVANAAVNGHTVIHHLALLQTLPILGEVDLLIFLTGINDLQTTLRFQGQSSQAPLQNGGDQLREHILSEVENTYPVYHRLEIYRLVRRASYAWVKRSGLQEEEIWDQVRLRKQRAAAPVVPLPDLGVGLQEYRERLGRLAQECRQRRVRCVFLTQPSLWRQDLTAEEEQLLLFGWVGRKSRPKGYVSGADAMRSLDAFNRALLDVCRQQSLECFDLAAAVPKSTSAFYDDVHFNEGGARFVAQALADFLLRAPPFAESAGTAQIKPAAGNAVWGASRKQL